MSTTTSTLTHAETLRILRASWFTPGRLSSAAKADNDDDATTRTTWGLPLVVWDEPGTGKSSAIEALAGACGFIAITIAMNNRSPEDVGGYAIPDGGRMRRVPDSWVHDANRSARAVVFFDEFTVDPERQAAALRVFSERMAGETRVGGHVRLIAAANPPSCAATPHELTPPAANRFGHLPWVGFSPDEFAGFLLGASSEIDPVDPVREEERVLAAWPTAYARSAALVAGYLRRFPCDLHSMPTSRSGEQDDLRWPSRRVWEMVARALAACEVHDLSPREREAFIAAFLPAGVCARFSAFLRDLDLAEPADYLDGRVAFQPDARIDKTYAVLEMTAGYLAATEADDRKLALARAKKWWSIAAEVIDHKYGGADIVIPGARIVSMPAPRGGPSLGSADVPEAIPVVARLHGALSAAQRAKRGA